MKDRSAKPLHAHVSSLGSSLAIVFEFLGMLGFAGLVGYALKEWVWPEQGALVLLLAMMLGLGIGIWHIVLRIRSAPVVHITEKEKTAPLRRSVVDAAESVEELRELRRKLDGLGRGGSGSEGDP